MLDDDDDGGDDGGGREVVHANSLRLVDNTKTMRSSTQTSFFPAPKSPYQLNLHRHHFFSFFLLLLLLLQQHLPGRVDGYYTLEEDVTRESNGWLVDEFNGSGRDPWRSPDPNEPGKDGGSDRSDSTLPRLRTSLNLTVGILEINNSTRPESVSALRLPRRTTGAVSPRPTADRRSSPSPHGSTEPAFWDYGSKDDVEPADYDYQSVLKDEPETPTCYGFLRLRRKLCKVGYGIGSAGLIGILAVGVSLVLVLALCAFKGCRCVQVAMRRRIRYVPVTTKD